MSCSFTSKTIKLKDFNHICRTCLCGDKTITPIFETIVGEVRATELLEYSIKIEVNETDCLPPNICENCLNELYRIYEFKKQCHEHEAVLKLLLQDPPVIIENNDKDSKDDEFPCNITIIEDDSEYRCDDFSDCDKKEPIDVTSEIPDSKEDVEKIKVKRRDHQCHVCSKFFSSNRFRAHLRTHSKEKPFKCDDCPQSFGTSANLRRHRMIHTGERPHRCHRCGRGFIQAKSLRVHEKAHQARDKLAIVSAGAMQFNCEFCGKGFKMVHSFNLHLEKHHSDMFPSVEKTEKDALQEEESREHVCEICNKAFKYKYKLKQHKLRHGAKTHLCSDCGKSFASSGGLQSHQKLHTGEKPHTCVVCKKSFAHVATFDTHMLIHSGIKPHSCPYCTKSFTQLTHLTYHLRTHSGEKPYSCSFCGKAFAVKGNLTVHVRTHTGETPYVCSVCGRGFYDSSSLKKHQKGHKGVDDGTNTEKMKQEKIEIIEIPVVTDVSCS